MVFPPEPPGEFLQRAEVAGLPKAVGLGPPIEVVAGRAGRLIEQSRVESVEYWARRAERLYNLAKQVARSLHYAAGKDYWLNVESLDAGTAGIEIRGGRIATWLVNPLADFLVAVENAEASRLRNCPICGHVFYARRLTQEACSQRCNATRRVRAWRAKHGDDYEYNRKLKLAGVKSEPKARPAKPRKEHGK